MSIAHGSAAPAAGHRTVPEETAVALVYGGSTEAVMMATPADLADFGIGFSLTEGIVTRRDEIEDLAIVPGPSGIEVRMWLAGPRAENQTRRRRRLAGPTGCGLCGIESLDEACRPIRAVSDHTDLDGTTLDGAAIAAAVAALASAQHLQHATRATHAAGFFSPEDGLVALREDVGRHNALDKLAGTLACSGVSTASGAVVITSRVSVEMVQKTAAIGAPVLIAVSAPTALAVRVAAAAGITLVAMARGASFEVYAHPQRIR
ncbi:formate dehydrogenase accessory sulfurtransferase FdhD [Rhodoplanes elegans]|uniref:formate dehydrogenase accessory sulfurtransferase FdhD n=1 Tax=Rhodoplanes elegans TaxID=29408 RepID=UPI001FE1476C|nr:formate dehydrogenase accessory sulfurtransferase FdhD [Rhodoplanes elegans]